MLQKIGKVNNKILHIRFLKILDRYARSIRVTILASRLWIPLYANNSSKFTDRIIVTLSSSVD